MPIHKKIIGGFKKILPIIQPFTSFIPGVGTAVNIAAGLLGGTRQVIQNVQQQVGQIAAGQIDPVRRFAQPFITPGAPDPFQAGRDLKEDVDRIAGEIRRGIRSRSNVPPRLRSAVDTELAGFVFGQPSGPPPADPRGTATSRYKAEVLAGIRSIDNVPAGVTISSAMKRELAASLLKKSGGGPATALRLRPSPAVVDPTEVAARRPFTLGGFQMPTRQLQPSFIPEPVTFGGFGGAQMQNVALPALGSAGALALRTIPALGTLARSFGRIMGRTTVGRGINAAIGWVRGNPGTAAAIAASMAVSVPQFTELLVEESVIAFQKQDCVLRRSDLKGFDRTVKIAKQLGVFTRRAPARSRKRRTRKHRHRVTNV